MEALERESWKSGGGDDAVVVEWEVGLAAVVGVTSNSRHWGVRDVDGCFGEIRSGRPSRPVIGFVSGAVGDGATDWKAWMGRASKNS